jgi:hypothetical protein
VQSLEHATQQGMRFYVHEIICAGDSLCMRLFTLCTFPARRGVNEWLGTKLDIFFT